jgi:hypothetical protein
VVLNRLRKSRLQGRAFSQKIQMQMQIAKLADQSIALRLQGDPCRM